MYIFYSNHSSDHHKIFLYNLIESIFIKWIKDFFKKNKCLNFIDVLEKSICELSQSLLETSTILWVVKIIKNIEMQTRKL